MDKPVYWFPAKRYGWGWGVPQRWQGWAVIAIYAVLMAVIVVRLRPDHAPLRFLTATAALSVLLVIVCWIKGEPPKWRWSDDAS